MLYVLSITNKDGNQIAYANLTKARNHARRVAKFRQIIITISEDFRGPVVAEYGPKGQQ